MKVVLLVVAATIASVGCEQMKGTGSGSAAMQKDNSAVNVRDRDAAAKTPIDQNETKGDVAITAEIRKRIVDTKMSVNAQNVKVMTQDGRVTLRGPVNAPEEKTHIEQIARDVAGATNVDSRLEVTAP